VSDIDTIAMGGLKVLDPNWPIREADIYSMRSSARVGPLFAPPQRDQKLGIFMEGKLALLYLIFMLMVTIAYVEAAR
jgi:hypothetical protein